MKSFELMICLSSASSAHFSMSAAPVEKFRMAGTRPSDRRLRMTTGVALTFGSSTPTRGASGNNTPRNRRATRSVRINKSRPVSFSPVTSSRKTPRELFAADSTMVSSRLGGAASHSTSNCC
jgi:hypothetical protein